MRSLLWNNPKTIMWLKNKLHNKKGIVIEGDTVLGLQDDLLENRRAQFGYSKNKSKKPYKLLVGDYKKAFISIEIDKRKKFQTEKINKYLLIGGSCVDFSCKVGICPL